MNPINTMISHNIKSRSQNDKGMKPMLKIQNSYSKLNKDLE